MASMGYGFWTKVEASIESLTGLLNTTKTLAGQLRYLAEGTNCIEVTDVYEDDGTVKRQWRVKG